MFAVFRLLALIYRMCRLELLYYSIYVRACVRTCICVFLSLSPQAYELYIFQSTLCVERSFQTLNFQLSIQINWMKIAGRKYSIANAFFSLIISLRNIRYYMRIFKWVTAIFSPVEHCSPSVSSDNWNTNLLSLISLYIHCIWLCAIQLSLLLLLYLLYCYLFSILILLDLFCTYYRQKFTLTIKQLIENDTKMNEREWKINRKTFIKMINIKCTAIRFGEKKYRRKNTSIDPVSFIALPPRHEFIVTSKKLFLKLFIKPNEK